MVCVMRTKFINDLRKRNFIADTTEGLEKFFENSERIIAYVGFDPTSDSLHVGSLLPLIMAKHFLNSGHGVIVLSGSATAQIGDPSGKSRERNLLSAKDVLNNSIKMTRQITNILGLHHLENDSLRLESNIGAFSRLSVIDFLRNIGKHFKVNHMLAKDSVRRRLDSEEGISFTEFSYSLLQAFDFVELNATHGCNLQFGGSDQWGNIVSGVDLVRKMNNNEVHGLTFPLLTKSDGTKMGKTEEGTIWLDPKKTSPFKFFQFWMNLTDEEAFRLAPMLLLNVSVSIEELFQEAKERPEMRFVQNELARVMTRFVHGANEMHNARLASQALFENNFSSVDAEALLSISDAAPVTEITKTEVNKINLVDLVIRANLATSRNQTRILIQQNAVKINGVVVNNDKHLVSLDDFIEGKVMVLSKGRKEKNIIKLV
jgi:tyrosyl-tRNA synthetase